MTSPPSLVFRPISKRFSRPDPLPDESSHLSEECSAAPGISPAPVADCEYLLRELYFPHHTDGEPEPELTARAITVRELRDTGFSVNRMTYVGAVCLGQLIAERLSRPRRGLPWRSLGVAKLQAGEVRSVRLPDAPDEQALVVIDTATEERPWHASIHARRLGVPDSRFRELRDLLIPLLRRTRMSIEEAYAPLDP